MTNNLFMANAVHEIRTPVQTIIGTLDLLSETALDTEQQEYVHQIRVGADILLNLVNDFLDFSKLNSQRMVIENIPFDVKSLTEETVHLIGLEAFAKGIEVVTNIDYSIPSLVMGDPTRVRQVLINLIKNALKFTERGYIYVVLKNNDGMLHFEVTDSGIGISEKQQKKLFTSYFQAEESTTRKYGGTGLGLPICRSLVEKMKGTIGVKANPYGGSVFWFNLPLVKSSCFDDKMPESPIPATSRIMIVDDSILAAKGLTNMLNYMGLQYIQTSSDPKDALLSLTYAEKIGCPFNIVFIDMLMPLMNGWNLAREIKTSSALKNTKLYLLVPEGEMGKEAKMKVLDWFAGFIYKPIRFEKLYLLLLETNAGDSAEKLIDEAQSAVVLDKGHKDAASELVKGAKILVTDDHPVNRKILVTFLKKFGAEIIEASNGQEAVDAVRRDPSIQMVFLDIQMPILTGDEAARILRNEQYQGVIIACTANDNKDECLSYQKIGMNDFLIKPFKKESIKLLLDKWKAVIDVQEAPAPQDPCGRETLEDSLWDTDDFNDTVGGDIDLGKSILLDYSDQTAELLAKAESALRTDDYDQLNMIAHTIKGSSAAISANKLRQLGETMNKGVKARDKDAVVKALKELKAQFELFLLQSAQWAHSKR